MIPLAIFTPVAKKKATTGFFTKLKRFLVVLVVLNVAYIVVTKWIFPPITTVMIASVFKGNGLTRDYITENEMGENIKLAVISSEDQLFYDHNGFDVDAIKKAMAYNKNPKHKKTIGASTISQQTAKNTFLWNGRDWFRKGLEVYHTFMIEWIWGKKRILETYLNIAEMGKGIFGIEAAAKHYFNKSAKDLSKSEAAWIAAILPNPAVYSVTKPTPLIVKRHAWILKQMNALELDSDIEKLMN